MLSIFTCGPTGDSATVLKCFIEANAHRIAHDVVEAPAFLAAPVSELEVSAERYPSVQFHARREHAGHVLQTGM